MEEWIPRYIFGYLIYIAFIIIIMANSVNIAVNIYDLTPQQKAVLENPNTDILSWIDKLLVLSNVSSPIFVVNILTIFLSFIFILALAKALKEVIPVLPS